jgi:hypothetical protein
LGYRRFRYSAARTSRLRDRHESSWHEYASNLRFVKVLRYVERLEVNGLRRPQVTTLWELEEIDRGDEYVLDVAAASFFFKAL